MDFLNKAKAALSENKTGGTAAPANTDPNAAPAAGTSGTAAGTSGTAAPQGEDYGDKAMDFIGKKTGHPMSRDTNEKITDGARGMYEKFSGKKVDPKYSN